MKHLIDPTSLKVEVDTDVTVENSSVESQDARARKLKFKTCCIKAEQVHMKSMLSKTNTKLLKQRALPVTGNSCLLKRPVRYRCRSALCAKTH